MSEGQSDIGEIAAISVTVLHHAYSEMFGSRFHAWPAVKDIYREIRASHWKRDKVLS